VRRILFRAGLVCLALVALAGCGGGGGGGTTTPSSSTPAAAIPKPKTTGLGTSEPEIKTQTAPTQSSTSPENQQGGAGDETPIATQAEFTGNGGDIAPPTIRVPPFIAVKVVLHSADGGTYGIEVAHHELSVDSAAPTATVTLSGLRAGKRYTVDVTGAPETLAIVANAEPGP
jgi:hypothetical protein